MNDDRASHGLSNIAVVGEVLAALRDGDLNHAASLFSARVVERNGELAGLVVRLQDRTLHKYLPSPSSMGYHERVSPDGQSADLWVTFHTRRGEDPCFRYRVLLESNQWKLDTDLHDEVIRDDWPGWTAEEIAALPEFITHRGVRATVSYANGAVVADAQIAGSPIRVTSDDLADLEEGFRHAVEHASRGSH